MNITFIVPKEDDRDSPLNQFAQCRVLPPAGLARMAGLAGKQAMVSVRDERVALIPHKNTAQSTVEVVVLFINSYNRERCLVLAKLYRDLGSYVVLSGPLLVKDYTEPGKYADSLFAGYGEDCMVDFLSDYQQGKAKAVYFAGNGYAPLRLAS
jgi:hypothetical protein